MSPYTVLVLFVSLCLIQSVMSQKKSDCCDSYGGKGTGQVGACGTIEACGKTCVEGKVPVLGSVCFGGCAPACGSVSICGECGCGCGCQ